MANLGGEASIELEHPIDAVYAVCADVERAPDWQDANDDLDVLERDGEGRPSVANATTDAKVRKITTKLRFSYDPPRRVAWEQQSGDLKTLDGFWELEDLGGGRTRATYRLDADPGRMLGMLVRGPVEERLREQLVLNRPGELRARLAG
jgi:ribosome-associated toxin RatA of RatAB toxin-antitoxin module